MAKIYISSTYEDLKEYREIACRVSKSLKHEVNNMEKYSAFSRPPIKKCLKDVDECDIYIGIFARRYGSIPPDRDLSFTELEYRRAYDNEKTRCLIFLLDKNADWKMPIEEDEKAREKLEKLRDELDDLHGCAYFNENKRDFARKIKAAIQNADKEIDEIPIPDVIKVEERKDDAKESLEAQKIFFTTVKIVLVFTLLAMILCSFSPSINSSNGIGLTTAFTFICAFSALIIFGSAIFTYKMMELKKANSI